MGQGKWFVIRGSGSQNGSRQVDIKVQVKVKVKCF